MKFANAFWLGGVVLLVAGALAIAQGPRRSGRADLMREKLGYAKDILEGLAREDFAEIKKGARALQALKESPEWPAMSRPATSRYGFYALEFQELLEQLKTKADEKNIDGATLAYLRLTTNCVNCHKELRVHK